MPISFAANAKYILVMGAEYSNNWQGKDEWRVLKVIVPVRDVRSERNYCW